MLPAVCSNLDVNTSVSEGKETTLALCNAKELHPEPGPQLQILYKTCYTAPPGTWLSFEKICSCVPNQWHRMASKDTPYLSGLQQRHWDKEGGKKRWFLPQVSSMLKLYESLPRKTNTQYVALTSDKVDAFILQNHFPGMASKDIPYLAEQKQSCP